MQQKHHGKGLAELVKSLGGDSYGLFSDIRYGEIGSTYRLGTPPLPACLCGDLNKCIL